MQNRSIFPYRRHGPKKRVKQHGSNRKSRGPQKGLPNSARDLLPMLQPATKALAQVLAGRAGASGQLGHARTMLAQAERMIEDRAHNRLTPAEREEFFEQLARLKLTLADAEAEAEVQAVEQHEPRPQAPPVDQERLKEMALALSGPGPLRSPHQARPSAASPIPSPAPDPSPTMEPASANVTNPTAAESSAAEAEPEQPEQVAPAAETDEQPNPDGRGRLVLPKASAGQAAQAVSVGAVARRRRRAAGTTKTPGSSVQGLSEEGAAPAFETASPAVPPAAPSAPQSASAASSSANPSVRGARLRDLSADLRRSTESGASATAAPDPNAGTQQAFKLEPPASASMETAPAVPDSAVQLQDGSDAQTDTNAKSPSKTTRRTSRKPKRQGVPEGWVIDEEGFVVPGAD